MSHTYKLLAASGLVKEGPGQISALTLTAGSDAATAKLMDEKVASGTQMWPTIKAATGVTVHVPFPRNLVFGMGCYVVITGTSPEVGVAYE